MTQKRLDGENPDPLDELNPDMRLLVQRLLRDPVPQDVTSRALDAARRVGISSANAEGASIPLRSRAAWRLLAVAASIGLVTALVWWNRGGSPARHVVVKLPAPPVPAVPEAPVANPVPSMWAYCQAARQSAEALDAVLDRDARWVLRAEPHSSQARALWGSTWQSL